MTPALLSPHAVAALLCANLVALIFLGLALVRISARIAASIQMQQEVLQMLVIAHAGTCEDGPVEQEQLEGEANRSAAA